MTGLEFKVILLSLKVAALSTVITIPAAVWISWVLVRKRIPGKALIEMLISFPLVAPPVIVGYLLLVLLGQNGFIGMQLYRFFGIRLTFNFAALVIASMVVSLPLAVRSIRAAFELIDPVYEKASLTLGASRMSTFFRVSLPMALPGILSGMVLSFARSLGEFGATITLAGNIIGKTQTISLMVYSNMQIPGMEKQVFTLIAVSVSISFAAILASEIINSKRMLFRK